MPLPTAKLLPKCYALNPPRISHFVVVIDGSPVAIVENKDLELAAAQIAILEPKAGAFPGVPINPDHRFP